MGLYWALHGKCKKIAEVLHEVEALVKGDTNV